MPAARPPALSTLAQAALVGLLALGAQAWPLLAAAQAPANGVNPPAGPQAATERQAQRARIEQARQAAEAQHAQDTAACQGRFQLTACLQDAQRQRRLSLDALRREALGLDEAERRERAEQRLQAQARRQAERAGIPAVVGAGSAGSAAHETEHPTAGASAPAATQAHRQGAALASGVLSRPASGAQAPADGATRPANTTVPGPHGSRRLPADAAGRSDGRGAQAEAQAQAQARAQRTAARQAAAASHAVAVQRRNAARDARRPPAAGLPPPQLSGSAPGAAGAASGPVKPAPR